jgi:hypothetical protein
LFSTRVWIELRLFDWRHLPSLQVFGSRQTKLRAMAMIIAFSATMIRQAAGG